MYIVVKNNLIYKILCHLVIKKSVSKLDVFLITEIALQQNIIFIGMLGA